MNELSLTADDQVIEPVRSLSPASPIYGFGSNISWRDRFRAFTQQPAIMRALPMLGLLAVVVIAGFLWLALREPPQRDLFRGLPEADKAAVAEALKQSDIMFNFNDTTGALTVAENDYHQAKLSLAAQGLPRSAPDGDSLISAMPMGASRAVEDEKLRSVRELELARTIEVMEKFAPLHVHLAAEQPRIVVRDRTHPSAAVTLDLIGRNRPNEAQVPSITDLVASSAPGLASYAIIVVDQHGRSISRQR